MPYELLTGDWEKVNDRLVQAILNEFHRSIEVVQDHLLIFQVQYGVTSRIVMFDPRRATTESFCC